MSLRTLRADAVRRLVAAGVESPEHDVRLLLAHLTGRPPALLTDLTAIEADRFEDLLRQRVQRVPLQHLTGEAPFRHLTLAVGPGAFVPRPETEVMTGWVVDRVRELATGGRRPIVVDLCTGTGAIAAAVATEVPQAEVHAVEVSPEAHAWALRNLPYPNVHLHLDDAAQALPDLDGSVDVVVSNPPYIPLDAYASVAPEVRDHDPALALFSGADGLDTVRAVVRTATRLLTDGGHLAVEHAEVQVTSAPRVVIDAQAFVEVRDHPDLSGRPRFVTAARRRRSPPKGTPGWQDDRRD